MKSSLSEIKELDERNSILNKILALDNVKIDKKAGLVIEGEVLGYNEVVFMVNYPDKSPEVLLAKEYISQKDNGYYAICCSDGTYLIKVTKDQVQRQFHSHIIVNPDPK